MKNEEYSNFGFTNRRNFMKQISTGAAGMALGSLGMTGCASKVPQVRGAGTLRSTIKTGRSRVSFVTGDDQRDATLQALKPLEGEIKKAIGEKQVVIKINSGQVAEKWWLNATDVNNVRGILDFLKPIYDKQVIVAESTAAGPTEDKMITTMDGFQNYNYMPLPREYNVKLVDLNEDTATTKFILDGNHHPLGIDIIDTFLDPNVYMISATRLKTHNCVIATLSLKNVVMASPINRSRQKQRKDRNQKPKMHSGGNRGLSYNMFRLANMGVQPDLAVLDGVVGMEGRGPVWGTPVEQGVVVASTDWLAADRLGVELMGIDYEELKYLQWCAAAGMGNDDLLKINIIGPDYTQHIIKYELDKNIEEQREWIREDFKS